MTKQSAEHHGRDLAVQMLRELHREWESVDLKGVPDAWISETMVSREPATMRSYLAMVRRNAAMERGFLCVLSDFIGGELSAGGCVNLDSYLNSYLTSSK